MDVSYNYKHLRRSSYLAAQKIVEKTKIGENVQILELDKKVLVQCNIVHHHYQEHSKILYTLRPINLLLICST